MWIVWKWKATLYSLKHTGIRKYLNTPCGGLLAMPKAVKSWVWDADFVYLVEKYFMKGDAYWLSQEDLQKYIDRVQKIAPNVIGNVGPEITMQDIDGKER